MGLASYNSSPYRFLAPPSRNQFDIPDGLSKGFNPIYKIEDYQ